MAVYGVYTLWDLHKGLTLSQGTQVSVPFHSFNSASKKHVYLSHSFYLHQTFIAAAQIILFQPTTNIENSAFSCIAMRFVF